MATIHIFPIHADKGRSVARILRDVTGYMEYPLRTEGGEFISLLECAVQTADTGFLLAKAQYTMAADMTFILETAIKTAIMAT